MAAAKRDDAIKDAPRFCFKIVSFAEVVLVDPNPKGLYVSIIEV